MKVPVWVVKPTDTIFYWVHVPLERVVHDGETLEIYAFRTREEAEGYRLLQSAPVYREVETREGTVAEIMKKYELEKFATIVPEPPGTVPDEVSQRQREIGERNIEIEAERARRKREMEEDQD